MNTHSEYPSLSIFSLFLSLFFPFSPPCRRTSHMLESVFIIWFLGGNVSSVHNYFSPSSEAAHCWFPHRIEREPSPALLLSISFASHLFSFCFCLFTSPSLFFLYFTIFFYLSLRLPPSLSLFLSDSFTPRFSLPPSLSLFTFTAAKSQLLLMHPLCHLHG